MQRFPWVTPLAYWLSIRKPAPGASLPPVGREVRSRRQYPSSQRQGQSRTVATPWPGNRNTNVRFWPKADIVNSRVVGAWVRRYPPTIECPMEGGTMRRILLALALAALLPCAYAAGPYGD